MTGRMKPAWVDYSRGIATPPVYFFGFDTSFIQLQRCEYYFSVMSSSVRGPAVILCDS